MTLMRQPEMVRQKRLPDYFTVTVKEYGLSNLMTSRSLQAIGEIGGARCCKRNSFLAILQAVEFVREKLHIEMETEEIVCEFSPMNRQCIGKRCPFSEWNHSQDTI